MPDCKAKVLNQKIFLFKISECCPFFSVLWADFVWVSMQVAVIVVVSLVPHFAALACGQNPFIQLMIYLRPLLLVISPF